jgi:hypothetical protein
MALFAAKYVSRKKYLALPFLLEETNALKINQRLKRLQETKRTSRNFSFLLDLI